MRTGFFFIFFIVSFTHHYSISYEKNENKFIDEYDIKYYLMGTTIFGKINGNTFRQFFGKKGLLIFEDDFGIIEFGRWYIFNRKFVCTKWKISSQTQCYLLIKKNNYIFWFYKQSKKISSITLYRKGNYTKVHVAKTEITDLPIQCNVIFLENIIYGKSMFCK